MFSHSQTVVVCGNCQTVLCQPTGGRARLTEGCSFRRKNDWLIVGCLLSRVPEGCALFFVLKCVYYFRNKFWTSIVTLLLVCSILFGEMELGFIWHYWLYHYPICHCCCFSWVAMSYLPRKCSMYLGSVFAFWCYWQSQPVWFGWFRNFTALLNRLLLNPFYLCSQHVYQFKFLIVIKFQKNVTTFGNNALYAWSALDLMTNIHTFWMIFLWFILDDDQYAWLSKNVLIYVFYLDFSFWVFDVGRLPVYFFAIRCTH